MPLEIKDRFGETLVLHVADANGMSIEAFEKGECIEVLVTEDGAQLIYDHLKQQFPNLKDNSI